ncbi:hypothetical protein D9611_014391 [Ephemerocybe angulata]|uniref:DUF7137 domain-containing protein n=1 Tax=Ephemerocybe angulata TaxID=980116 RepID=A0A8H5F9D2_9AGAR|nr:hypothetical protein D9611_014391 [Tulosesus angulatus]
MADNGNGNNNGGNNNNNGNGNANTNTASSTTTRLIIPASAPAGEIVFTQPLPTVTSYKVAVCDIPAAARPQTTLEEIRIRWADDGIIAGTATQVVWDPYSYQMSNPNTPLPQAVCTLMICDERGFGAMRRAGTWPNNALQFALYTPQAYTPLASGWKCTICNGAMSTATHPAAISLLVTILICLLSGFHLLRTTNNR